MWEHEILRNICDKINQRYRLKTTRAITNPYYYNEDEKVFWYDFAISDIDKRMNKIWIIIDHTIYKFITIDVREIIFNPEFMDKYFNYYNMLLKEWKIELTERNHRSMGIKISDELIDNLDDPVQYLNYLISKA